MKQNLIIMAVIAAFLSSCGGCRDYLRQQDMMDKEAKGKGELLEAESSKKVMIETARAENESANLKAEAKIKRAKAENEAKIIIAQGEAQAEIERAKGVAEANKIIGESLKGNEAYLKYLWVTGLKDGKGERIYIPTEAGLPIFEAK